MPKRKEFFDKIKCEMDTLQDMMEANDHLRHKDKVVDQYYTCTKYRRFLDEEDNDYIDGVAFALMEDCEWNIPEEAKRINKPPVENKYLK